MKLNKVIVTSGPTREWIDPVRYISNASSGKLGFCIVQEFKKYCENVVLIHGPVVDQYIPKEDIKKISVETTIGMLDALIREIESETILVMSAAPLDYKPKTVYEEKLKKLETNTLSIELEENPDILMNISEYIKSQNLTNIYRVGFAAETSNLRDHSIEKLNRKNLDLIVGNTVYKNESGFGDLNSQLHLYFRNGKEQSIGPDTKEFLAKVLSEIIMREISN
jgi:phosphopantothenoylcysteine synthetase/decarboxylase